MLQKNAGCFADQGQDGLATSFPLDGGGGFAGDVVDDAVDAADFVDDPAGNRAQDLVGDVGEVGGVLQPRLARPWRSP